MRSIGNFNSQRRRNNENNEKKEDSNKNQPSSVPLKKSQEYYDNKYLVKTPDKNEKILSVNEEPYKTGKEFNLSIQERMAKSSGNQKIDNLEQSKRELNILYCEEHNLKNYVKDLESFISKNDPATTERFEQKFSEFQKKLIVDQGLSPSDIPFSINVIPEKYRKDKDLVLSLVYDKAKDKKKSIQDNKSYKTSVIIKQEKEINE